MGLFRARPPALSRPAALHELEIICTPTLELVLLPQKHQPLGSANHQHANQPPLQRAGKTSFPHLKKPLRPPEPHFPSPNPAHRPTVIPGCSSSSSRLPTKPVPFSATTEVSSFSAASSGWIPLPTSWEGAKVWMLDPNIGEVCGEVKKLGGPLGITSKFWSGKESYSSCESKLSPMGLWVPLAQNSWLPARRLVL